MVASNPARATRERLVEATRTALARYGPRKIALTDIARLAGVSRPTLYKYFPSKEALLAALAEHEHRRFDDGVTAAVRGVSPEARIDAALRFIVDYQANDPTKHLVAVEPAFILEQVQATVDVMRRRMQRLFDDVRSEHELPGDARADDLADAIVRIALSHYLMPSSNPGRLLRELRAVARVGTLATA
jgi:AcrR family transcriptional regulator